MTAHTPGPWKVAQQNDDYHCVETVDCAICNDVRYESDARLIAAAPDLLDVVQMLVAECGDMQNQIIDMARAAIAKAGQS